VGRQLRRPCATRHVEAEVKCAVCHQGIPNVGGPCPHCGSRTRAKSLTATLAFVGLFRARWPGRGKARRWGELATRFQRDGLGRLVHFRREFDKDADEYYEHVEDAVTGDVIHHVEEPLSEHRGHGSAKREGRA
jgi:hypothetical protein